MTWLLLALAIVTEVIATASLRAAGEGRVVAIVTVVLGYGIAFTTLAVLVRRMEVGIVYAIWSGAGTALVALVGVLVLGESLRAVKLAGIALIIAGVVLVNLAPTEAKP